MERVSGVMIPLVSQFFRGSVVTEHRDLEPGRAVSGRPAWRPDELLHNLELRLGLPPPDGDEALRVQLWSRRLGVLSKQRRRFFTGSYESDPLGTGKMLLGWRDDLVLAGWSGQAVPGGGERLETLAELESAGDAAEMAAGFADRLVRARRELEGAPPKLFDGLELAEARGAWPVLWRSVFELLERGGTRVEHVVPVFSRCAGNNDLSRAQALLVGEVKGPLELAGDGSLLVLTGETSWELARAVAAWLGALDTKSAVVVRGGDTVALEAAFDAGGLPAQGLRSRSQWRPALQVLPLALELMFEPRDPARVLELLTLPEGPFRGVVGRELACALREMPGIGGRPWLRAKEKLSALEGTGSILGRVAAWLEAPGFSMVDGAPREALVDAAGRVEEWLKQRLAAMYASVAEGVEASGHDAIAAALAEALRQSKSFAEVVRHDVRPRMALVEARQLLEEVAMGGHRAELHVEVAGRIDHVEAPASLRSRRDVVVWWYCASEAERTAATVPWRHPEIAALEALGIRFVPPAERLGAEAESCRRVVLAARGRLVLAMPRSALSEPLAPHPIWDEIVALAGASDSMCARLMVDVKDWLEGSPALPRLGLENPEASVTEHSALALPEPRAEWALPSGLIGFSERRVSASGIERLLGCPLQWVLRHEAELYASSVDGLASGPRLNGKLAHRLVEELHRSGELSGGAGRQDAAQRQLERLFRDEAAVLLGPGQASERAQLARQLCSAVEYLGQVLDEAELTVAGVEVETEATWRHGRFYGRIDLLLRDGAGLDVILDFKWGARSYRQLLEAGSALQLAAYAAARRAEGGGGEWPHAGYLSVSDAQVLATNDATTLVGHGPPLSGQPLSETWRRAEVHAGMVIDALSSGRVAVTGVRRSLPLVADEPQCFETISLDADNVCKYCKYPAICGRSWEEFT